MSVYSYQKKWRGSKVNTKNVWNRTSRWGPSSRRTTLNVSVSLYTLYITLPYLYLYCSLDVLHALSWFSECLLRREFNMHKKLWVFENYFDCCGSLCYSLKHFITSTLYSMTGNTSNYYLLVLVKWWSLLLVERFLYLCLVVYADFYNTTTTSISTYLC